MDVMTLLLVVANLVALALGIGAYARTLSNDRSSSVEMRRDLDELMSNVETMARIGRKEQMRRVRAAAAHDPASAPPQLQVPLADAPPSSANLSPAERKVALRRRFFSPGNNQ